MSKYEKPMVMVNEELAEGVYAASGKWQYKNSNTFGGADVPNGSVGLDIRVENTWKKDNGQQEDFVCKIPVYGDGSATVVNGTGASAEIKDGYLIIHDSSIANPGEVEDIKVVLTPNSPGGSIGIIE